MVNQKAFISTKVCSNKSLVRATYPWAGQIIPVKDGWWVFQSNEEAEKFRIENHGEIIPWKE